MQSKTPQPFWRPLYAGLGLGLTLIIVFLISGHGLSAYGFFRRLTAQAMLWIAPIWGQTQPFFENLLQEQPLDSWMTWQILGLALGAVVASVLGGRWRWRIERGHSVGAKQRLALAFSGGILTGFGAALAGGCTSSLGLSGAATLAMASFVFLAAFFVAGIVVSYLIKRIW